MNERVDDTGVGGSSEGDALVRCLVISVSKPWHVRDRPLLRRHIHINRTFTGCHPKPFFRWLG